MTKWLKKVVFNWLFGAPRGFVHAEPSMEKQSKAFYCKQMMDNPMYREIMDKIEADGIRKWRSTPIEAKEIREQYYTHMLVLSQIDNYFKSYVAEVEMDKKIVQMRNNYKPE